MSAKPRSSAAIALLLTGATLMFGCGDSGDDSDTTAEASKQFAAPTEAPADAQEGGSLTVLAASDVDNIDPGATYYQFGYMVTDATQSGLVGYAPGDIDARPLLAAEEPTVSDDGKTITYKLRDDVKFSPPVNRTVTSADVKYAIERALLPGVANGYAQTYLKGIVGFDDALKQAQSDPTGGAPDISGITTPDDTTLVIELDDTTSIGVEGALSLPVSAPVPEEYAKPYDAENPSTYGDPPGGHRPVHDRERRRGRAHRLHAEQGDPPGPQPELGGLGRRLPARLPRRDHDPGGLRRHRFGREEDPHRQRPGQRRLHRPAVGDQAGGDVGRVRAADADRRAGATAT